MWKATSSYWGERRRPKPDCCMHQSPTGAKWSAVPRCHLLCNQEGWGLPRTLWSSAAVEDSHGNWLQYHHYQNYSEDKNSRFWIQILSNLYSRWQHLWWPWTHDTSEPCYFNLGWLSSQSAEWSQKQSLVCSCDKSGICSSLGVKWDRFKRRLASQGLCLSDERWAGIRIQEGESYCSCQFYNEDD